MSAATSFPAPWDRIFGGEEPTPIPESALPDEQVPVDPEDIDAARPVDIDDCGRCEGQGMFIDVVDGEAGWRVCGWCAGTGQRGAA